MTLKMKEKEKTFDSESFLLNGYHLDKKQKGKAYKTHN
jgi:hypothetical protein